MAATAPARARRTRRPSIPDRRLQLVQANSWQPRGPRLGMTFVDFLCGAGGSAAGMSNAGWELVFAANHWQVAIDTHQANFPDVWHECVDVTTINLRKLPRANALWISPICTEASPAGGNNTSGWRASKAAEAGQTSLLPEPPVEQAGMEKTRATFWEAIRYAELWRPEIIIVENVPDVIRKWALFPNWLGCMETWYDWQLINVNSAHVGDLAAGIPYAPQWRDRLYGVFVRKDIGRVPDVTPRPLSYCFACREVVHGRQTWCKAAQARWLKYGRYRRDPRSTYGSYWYTCPRGCRDASGERARVEPFVLPAVAVIDLDDLGTPVGDGQLKTATLRRMAEGQRLFWSPGATLPPTFAFNANHDDGQRRMYLPTDRPLSALTTKMGQGLCLPPYTVIPGGRWPANPVSMHGPARTRLATESEALVFPPGDPEAFVAVMRHNMAAVTLREPIPTVVASGQHFALVLPYHTDRPAAPPIEPLETVLTKDRFTLLSSPGALTTVRGSDGGQVELRNCRARMFKAAEAARAQVLPVDDGYVITGTGEQQMAQIGNAVSSNAAQWLGGAAAEVLSTTA